MYVWLPTVESEPSLRRAWQSAASRSFASEAELPTARLGGLGEEGGMEREAGRKGDEEERTVKACFNMCTIYARAYVVREGRM